MEVNEQIEQGYIIKVPEDQLWKLTIKHAELERALNMKSELELDLNWNELHLHELEPPITRHDLERARALNHGQINQHYIKGIQLFLKYRHYAGTRTLEAILYWLRDQLPQDVQMIVGLNNFPTALEYCNDLSQSTEIQAGIRSFSWTWSDIEMQATKPRRPTHGDIYPENFI